MYLVVECVDVREIIKETRRNGKTKRISAVVKQEKAKSNCNQGGSKRKR